MKKLFYLLLLSVSFVSLVSSQEDLWQSMPALGDITSVEDTPGGVYILSEGGLFLLSPESLEQVVSIGKEKGLSDTNILQIGYDRATSSLIVYYKSGNIDIINADGKVRNISAVYENLVIQDRAITRMVFDNGRTFLSTHFGILELDVANASIVATYMMMTPIMDIAICGDRIYALKQNGELVVASLNANLQDPEAWTTVSFKTSIEANSFTNIFSSDGVLMLLDKEKTLHEYAYETHTLQPREWYVERGIANGTSLVLLKNNEIVRYSPNEGIKRFSFEGDALLDGSVNNESHLFYGVRDSIVLTLHLDSEDGSISTSVPSWNGPADNHFFDAMLYKGYYYAVGGGRGIDRYWTPGSVKVREPNGVWHSITYRELPEEFRHSFYDLVSVVPDPNDPMHIYAGAWGEGLYEFNSYQFVALYNTLNSPLQSALPDDTEHLNRYVRVGSLVFDEKGGLWMMQGGVQNNIYYYDKDKKWHNYFSKPIAGVNSFLSTVILPGGSKWTCINRRGGGIDGSQGIFIFDDKGTPNDLSDDFTNYISQFSDRNGKLIEATRYYCMKLDNAGGLWIGSNKGPLLINNYQAAVKGNTIPVAVRPIGGVEPNLYYMLDNVPIIDIAIDKNNNKWFATEGEGIYLVNEDVSEILEHFTAENSILPSNAVNTLDIDNETGLLFIGTDVGLVTYQTGSRRFDKEQRSEMHVYPNPLRPEDPDLITIVGLTAGMEIKVTDVSGRLLHSAVSNGASYKFNARGDNGERLPSGVYLIALYDPETKMPHYIKMTIIN